MYYLIVPSMAALQPPPRRSTLSHLGLDHDVLLLSELESKMLTPLEKKIRSYGVSYRFGQKEEHIPKRLFFSWFHSGHQLLGPDELFV